MLKQITITLLLALTLALAIALPVQAIQNYGTEADAEVVAYLQPNEGTPVTFDAKFWGNTILWERETTSGYTIVLNEATGYWCYAILSDAGNYISSSLKVGIDNPVGITQHLRRSPECLAELASLLADFDAGITAAYADYQLHRDELHEFTLAILFFEFEDVRHKGDEENPGYTSGDIELMFLSEGVYKGARSDQDPPAQTPEGEEPFGSVRDWFGEMSSGYDDNVLISAGGPFENEEMLIINEINNGEIQWLEMPYPKDDWGEIVEYDGQNVRFHYSLVRRKAEDDGLIDWDQQPRPYDRLIYVHAGKWGNLGGWAYQGGNMGYSELQSWPDHPSVSINGYDPSVKLTNIGDYCHELMHACMGVPDPHDNNSAEVMTYGCWRSPFAEYGSYEDVDLETCTFTRGTTPCRPNPQFLHQLGWCSLEEITEDRIGQNQLVITYSQSQPTIFYFDYDISHGAGGEQRDKKGRFYLENRHMVTEAEEDENIDFNSYSMGSYDWGLGPWSPDEIGGNNVPLNSTGDKNNLHIWHKEGWKDDPFTSSYNALNTGILLENADGVNDGGIRGDGNDIFPGSDDITDFGPGTGEHHPWSGGGQVPDFDIQNFLFGSSHDVVGAGPDLDAQGNYRELQTGFCVKNIVADDQNDRITCDVYTNYWGGDVAEDLTLEGTNIYLGQGCNILDGGSITASGANGRWEINLDSDVNVESGGSLVLSPQAQPVGVCDVHLNDHKLWVKEGGDFSIASGQHPVSLCGPGEIWLQDEFEIDGVSVFINDFDGPFVVRAHDVIIRNGGLLSIDVVRYGCMIYNHQIIIEPGGSLEIETYRPGSLLFKCGRNIVYRGRGNIVGEAGAEVLFTPDQDNPSPGDWTGLEFENVAQQCTLKYVDIEYADKGVKQTNCGNFVTLDHVNITNFQTAGIYLVNSSPTITYSSASDAPHAASEQPIGLLANSSSSPIIKHCSFDNNYKGVELNGLSTAARFGYCSFSDNENAGIIFNDATGYLWYSTSYSQQGYNHIISNDAVAGVWATGQAHPYLGNGTSSQGKNSIHSNVPYQVKNQSSYQVKAEYNWWNSASGPNPAQIYGNVDYTPWLTTPPGGGPVAPPPKGNGGGFIAGADDDESDALNLADSLFAEGEWEGALEAYAGFIEEYRNSANLFSVVRQMRQCYRALDRRVEWGDWADGLAADRNFRAPVKPLLAGLRSADLLESGEADDALNLVAGALRGMERDEADYPGLLFQLGIIQHYGLNDPEVGAGTFERFMEWYEEHPLYSAAAIELGECRRDQGNVDSPPEPKEPSDPPQPTNFALFPPYPNPFNSLTRLRFGLPSAASVEIALWDLEGRRLETLVTGSHPEGRYEAVWDARGFPTGIYLVTMRAGDFRAVRKVMLVR